MENGYYTHIGGKMDKIWMLEFASDDIDFVMQEMLDDSSDDGDKTQQKIRFAPEQAANIDRGREGRAMRLDQDHFSPRPVRCNPIFF